MINREKNLRASVLEEGLIFYLIDFTDIFITVANGGGTGGTGRRFGELSGIP
jgi:hypothetical protein